MSRKIMYLLISLCLLCVQAQAIPDGLVGYWSFDEGAGDIAFDGSGNGNDGVLTGGPVWVEGILGGALDFSGSNSFVAAPTIPIDSRSFTVAMWINSSAVSGDQVVFGQHESGSQNLSLHYRITGSGVVRMGFYSNDLDSPSGVITEGTWTHLAFVYDFESGDRSIYADGVQIAQASGVNPYLGTAGDTRIGQWNNNQYFDGMIDDVQLYHNALTESEIQSIMNGLGNPNMASSPNPEDASQDVLRDSVLSWTPGEMAGTRDLYVGDSIEDVNSMTVPTAANLAVTSFDPGRLEFGRTYYWRVDEVNSTPDKTVFKGDIWSFTAEPYSILISEDSIGVTASSIANEFSVPEKTIDGSGLGADDTHSMTSEDMWFTAAVDLDPWIQYEFDGVQKLDVMKVWNSNSAAEMAIGWGVKDLEIAYSVDGENWGVLEGATQLSRAPGFPTYNQYDEIAFNGVAAKFVRLNIASNWGGILMSYSLSEVQFTMIPAAARTPDPVDGDMGIVPNVVATWRAGREAAQSTIYVGMDQNEVADGLAPSLTSNTNSADLSELDLELSGAYYWRVDEVNEAEAISVWAGPVWSFTTADALVVDDFESYNNISPDRPFQAWLDGFGYSADEFFPVAYPGNGTGAGIGHDIWSIGSPYYDGSLMETSNTLPGSDQSMPFYYSNSGSTASETLRKFTVPQDWTVGGVKLLSIPFSGTAGNTGTLYAKINGTKVTYPRDASNLAMGGWLAFNIDLTGMNVQSVTELAIGVDGSNASGMLLIDDITLHSEAGEVITPVDPGTEGLVAAYDFEGNANDVSGNGNNGTVNGDAQFSTGHTGSAIDCDGIDDYVSTDKVASQLGIGGNAPRTISSWVFTRSFQDGGIYDVGARVATQDFSLRTLATENTWRIQYWGGDTDFTLDTANKWVHFTHVHDGVNTKIYANGVLLIDWAKTIDTPDTNPFQIGCYGWQNDYFDGLIDEVRVYDRALSAGEALSLAGGTAPIDKPF
ncbi:MAG: hypothetical protein GY809_02000 [Planctomycetes bacterium]|nr:hypothetical protein [Planctomycetota bacterium]